MAEPGWYPDPEGAPGRFRYWDGTRWAAETVDAPPTGARHSNRRRALLIAAGVAVLLVIMVGLAVIVIRPDRGAVAGWQPPPAPAVTSDDSSPSATPRPSPSSSPTPAARPAAHCPTGEPSQTTQHAKDGRVHGGQLSFAPVHGGGLGSPEVDDHYGWWYDEHAQTGSRMRLAIGAVAIRDGFRTARQAARSSMACVISGSEYRDDVGQQTLRSRKISVDGATGWELITQVRTDADTRAGDRIRLVVVDAGAPGSFSIFVGSAPIGDSARIKIVNRTVAGLRVGY